VNSFWEKLAIKFGEHSGNQTIFEERKDDKTPNIIALHHRKYLNKYRLCLAQLILVNFLNCAILFFSQKYVQREGKCQPTITSSLKRSG
jgi:hypothetical protein